VVYSYVALSDKALSITCITTSCKIGRLWMFNWLDCRKNCRGLFQCEDGFLLGCCDLQSGRSLPTFQGCLLPPSSGRWVRNVGKYSVLRGVIFYNILMCSFLVSSTSTLLTNVRIRLTFGIDSSTQKLTEATLNYKLILCSCNLLATAGVQAVKY
jgi:hypothetical protein